MSAAPGASISVSTLADLVPATAFVEQAAAAAGADADTRFALRLALEEAFTNIMRHGYAGADGPVRITLAASRDNITLSLHDRAPPFDPGNMPAADTKSHWQQRDAGGLGWHLLRQVMDQVRYERNTDGENVLTLVKRFAADAS